MDERETEALMGTVAIGSMISIVSVLFLVTSAFLLGKWRKSYWRVILCLAFSDLTVSCSFVAGAMPVFLWLEPLSEVPCNIQGALVQFGGSGTVYYALVIAFVLYMQVVRGTKITLRMEVAIHLIWLPPTFLLALLPLDNPGGIHYDNSVGWCWIAENPKYARFIWYYMWVWFVIAAIIGLYYAIFSHMRRGAQQVKFARLTEIASGSVYSQQAKSSQRLLLYPLAFIIFWIPATTNRILEATGHSVFAVTYLECFFVPLQGITNTLIYLFTSQAHKDIYRGMRRQPRHGDLATEGMALAYSGDSPGLGRGVRASPPTWGEEKQPLMSSPHSINNPTLN